LHFAPTLSPTLYSVVGCCLGSFQVMLFFVGDLLLASFCLCFLLLPIFPSRLGFYFSTFLPTHYNSCHV
ncbi:hypothetical protein CLOM_g12001, partial [Closterium sp. NIES-68]